MHIQIGSKVPGNQRCYKAGVRWISNIIHEDEGRMLTMVELETKFNINIPFAEYLDVKMQYQNNGGRLSDNQQMTIE